MLRQKSCTGPGYKYQTPAIVKINQSKYKSITFFWLRPPLRSRSRVDLDEFFSEYGCINPVDLHCLSISTIMVIPLFVWLHRSGRPPLHELDQDQVIGSTLE